MLKRLNGLQIRSRIVPIALLAITFSIPLAAAEPDPVLFNRDIRPILSDKCYTCHGPDEANRTSPLRFDSEEGPRVELRDGKRAIVPGNPEASELIRRVESDDQAVRMPPAYMGHDRLKDREITLLRRWVEQGAQWQKHWSFLAPTRPAPPEVKHQNWVRNPVDGFIARRLEREGMAPAAEADRATLIRRVTLDLTGLPPTIDEIDAFLADSTPKAYEKVIDRLLATPAYAERMAYRWLDAARYADTNGYQNDQERYMWRWRDWVIDAYAKNMPFDQFTVEQIAGDLLPNASRSQIVATGFNRNHRGNGETGIVPEEYHVEYVVDRVEATSTVWLGLTMGCARCHDHKYDPITQKDFYRFYAYFNNVPDRGRYFKYGNTPPIITAPTEQQQALLDRLDDKLKTARVRLAEAQSTAAAAQKAWESYIVSSGAGFDWGYERQQIIYAPLDGADVTFKDGEPAYEPGRIGQAAVFDGIRYIDLGDQADFGFQDKFTLSAWIYPQNDTAGIITRMRPEASPRGNVGYGLMLNKGKLHFRIEAADIDDRMRVETADALTLNEWHHVAVVYDASRLTKGISLYVDAKRWSPHVITDHSNNETNSTDPLRIGFGPGPDDRFRGRIDDVRVYRRALSESEIAVVSTPESLDAIVKTPEGQRTKAQADKLRLAFFEHYAPTAITAAWHEAVRLEIERDALFDSFPTVMVMGESEQMRPTHLLKRGAYDAPGEQVYPDVPGMLPKLPDGAAKNRLALAKWIVDPSNPLTARVAVNRLWQMLFGAGIVRTVEDFGSQGEWPTHPELLDWLAVEFMDSGWNVNHIVKTIVTSATYRQSSAVTDELMEKDPENRFISRGPRIRLPAETVRDQALAIAGVLHEEVGGPSVKPYQPGGLWEELSNAGEYKHGKDDDLYRRSIYTFWKRTIGPPAMLTFDAAARETCIVRESRTNTPLQALNLMNDVTYLEASRLLAERMLSEGGESDSARLSYGFRLATAREPARAEEEVLLRSLRRYEDRYKTNPADAEKYLSQGEHARNKKLNPTEHAAYAAVASMILNLDETITKE